jgi:hypothetical protein
MVASQRRRVLDHGALAVRRRSGGEGTITSQHEGELGVAVEFDRRNDGGREAHGLALGGRLRCAGCGAAVPEAALAPAGGRGDADRVQVTDAVGVKARAIGVGTAANVGEVWSWAMPVMEAPVDGGTVLRLGPLSLPFAITACEWRAATGCVSGLTVAAWEGTDGAGRADAGGSTWE